MPTPRSSGRALALAFAALLLCKSPAAAFDLFATHEVTVQFANTDGQPMAGADVSVYAPGDPKHVVKTGKTGTDGKFTFGTDRDGLWTAEAHVAGDIARATIRVGGASDDRGGGEPSPYLVIGGLAVLLVIAVWYRYLRARARRRGL